MKKFFAVSIMALICVMLISAGAFAAQSQKGDPTLAKVRSASDLIYDNAMKVVKMYTDQGIPAPSSAVSGLYNAYNQYNQLASLANQMGLSNDPSAVHARSRIQQLKEMLGI